MKKIDYTFADTGEWAVTVYEDGRRLLSKRAWSWIEQYANDKLNEIKAQQAKEVFISKKNHGRKPRSLSNEQVLQAKKMSENGMKLREIGRHFGVSHETIRRYFKEIDTSHAKYL